MFRAGTAEETNKPGDETQFSRDAHCRKRSTLRTASSISGGTMTAQTNLIRYFAIRVAAFVGLTAASTAVMALPYLG